MQAGVGQHWDSGLQPPAAFDLAFVELVCEAGMLAGRLQSWSRCAAVLLVH